MKGMENMEILYEEGTETDAWKELETAYNGFQCDMSAKDFRNIRSEIPSIISKTVKQLNFLASPEKINQYKSDTLEALHNAFKGVYNVMANMTPRELENTFPSKVHCKHIKNFSEIADAPLYKIGQTYHDGVLTYLAHSNNDELNEFYNRERRLFERILRDERGLHYKIRCHCDSIREGMSRIEYNMRSAKRKVPRSVVHQVLNTQITIREMQIVCEIDSIAMTSGCSYIEDELKCIYVYGVLQGMKKTAQSL
jgi:hypothetical protein